MNQFIVSFFTISILGIVFSIAINGNKIGTDKIDVNSYIFRPNKFYLILGLLCLIVSILILVLIIYMRNEIDFLDFFLVITPFAVLFFTIGIYYCLEFKNQRIIFLETSLKVTDWLKRDVIIDYQDFESASFNSVLGKIILMSKKKQKVKILQFIVGQNTLLDVFGYKTSLDLTAVKIAVNRKMI